MATPTYTLKDVKKLSETDDNGDETLFSQNQINDHIAQATRASEMATASLNMANGDLVLWQSRLDKFNELNS